MPEGGPWRSPRGDGREGSGRLARVVARAELKLGCILTAYQNRTPLIATARAPVLIYESDIARSQALDSGLFIEGATNLLESHAGEVVRPGFRVQRERDHLPSGCAGDGVTWQMHQVLSSSRHADDEILG